jgi:hypothetical protein
MQTVVMDLKFPVNINGLFLKKILKFQNPLFKKKTINSIQFPDTFFALK